MADLKSLYANSSN